MKGLTRRAFAALAVAQFTGSETLGADEAIAQAFVRLYNFDFKGAFALLDAASQRSPADPLPYAVRASALLFSEMERLGVLESEFFLDDDRIAEHKGLKPDPEKRKQFYWATQQARNYAEAALTKEPNDTNALFALSLAWGTITDYGAFIEKRQIASLSTARTSHNYALRLLAVDPKFYDAYLTTGISEYLLGSLPFFVKWFVRFDQTKGSKKQAEEDMRLVAKSGRYLGPFARILLIVSALRDKRLQDAERILAGLVKEFPENRLMQRELEKMKAGKLGAAQPH